MLPPATAPQRELARTCEPSTAQHSLLRSRHRLLPSPQRTQSSGAPETSASQLSRSKRIAKKLRRLRPLANRGESTSRILLGVGGRANFEFVSKSFSSLT